MSEKILNQKQTALVDAILSKIETELERVYWNIYQKEMESPFRNTGTTYMENPGGRRNY